MSGLNDLEPGDVAVMEPVENVEVEAHGLADSESGMLLLKATVETDGGLLAAIESLTVVRVVGDTYYCTPLDHSTARRVHDEAVAAVEAMGGEVVDDITEVPA